LIAIAAGEEHADAVLSDRRAKGRVPYQGWVVLLLLGPAGERYPPRTLRAHDISSGGICVVSPQMMHVNSEGAIQMVRSDGSMAMAGVRVCHCRYIGKMKHHVGLAFIPMPEDFENESFLDEDGRMKLLDLRLESNRNLT
jgi:hypothetical protein